MASRYPNGEGIGSNSASDSSEKSGRSRAAVWRTVFSVVAAVLATFAVFSVPTLEGVGVLGKLQAVFPLHAGEGVAALAFFCWFSASLSRSESLDVRSALLAMALSACVVLGRSLSAYGDLSFVSSSVAYLACSVLFFIGYSCLFYFALIFAFSFFNRFGLSEESAELSSGGGFVVCLVIILVCYLPYMVVAFPGQTCADFVGQLKQFYGAEDASNHQPWFMTLLFGSLYQAGYLVSGSSWGGLFAVSFVQTLSMAATFSFYVVLASKLGCPKAVRVGLLAFFALCPIFPAYAQWCVKNTLGAVVLSHFCVQLTIKMFDSKGIAPRYASWPAIALTALLGTLSRNDSLYIVVAFLLVAIVLLKSRQRCAAVVTTVCVAVLFAMWGHVVLPAAGIASGNVREALSLPLLQTTKCVESHLDDLTDDEANALQEPCSVSLSELPDLYSIRISDNVKAAYTFMGDDLKNYAQAYVSLGMKYPADYMEVFLAHSFGYWYPGANGQFVLSETTPFSEPIMPPMFVSQSNEDVDLSDSLYNLKEVFPQAKHVMAKAIEAFGTAPLFSLLFSPGFYFWISIIAAVALAGKDRKFAVVLVPIFVLFLICCASPLNGSARYALPVILMAPMLTAWACAPRHQGALAVG